MAGLNVDVECTNGDCYTPTPSSCSQTKPIDLTANATGLMIEQPIVATPLPSPIAMSTPGSTTDPGSVSIKFQAQVPSAIAAATIDWDNTLEYQTSGGYPVKNIMDNSIRTCAGSSCQSGSTIATKSYAGLGGWWKIVATLQGAGDCRALPVTGNNPGVCTVTSELNTLYGKYIPNNGTSMLLSQLANSEASFGNTVPTGNMGQFSVEALKQPMAMCSVKGV